MWPAFSLPATKIKFCFTAADFTVSLPVTTKQIRKIDVIVEKLPITNGWGNKSRRRTPGSSLGQCHLHKWPFEPMGAVGHHLVLFLLNLLLSWSQMSICRREERLPTHSEHLRVEEQSYFWRSASPACNRCFGCILIDVGFSAVNHPTIWRSFGSSHPGYKILFQFSAL